MMGGISGSTGRHHTSMEMKQTAGGAQPPADSNILINLLLVIIGSLTASVRTCGKSMMTTTIVVTHTHESVMCARVF